MAKVETSSLRQRLSAPNKDTSDSAPIRTQHESSKSKQDSPITLLSRIIFSPSFIALPLACILVFTILHFVNKPSIGPRIWKKEELAGYNGTDENLPILLGILGSVFDVTRGRSHYGIGGSYNHFAGRDASRAFVTGNFTGTGLIDDLKGLSSPEVKSIVDWRDFYHRSYIYVGKLVGRYYKDNGEPTKELKGIEAKAARGAQILARQKAEEEKLPNCNSKWSQQSGGQVWCDSGYPRLVEMSSETGLYGNTRKRCVCLKAEELNHVRSELYEGCDQYSSSCKVS